ncbi:hypothetical protein SAMN04487905_1274 [Actinopolyspora xinjiangensis]|uniref:Uncharacterized protein n=1 Tax=Actinopolyspora xinjiangensis TaxID=405564 RepID=A0A1H0X3U5_9ACTN|nr:hypothetical protein SAMN04487905_1274 [Actinopolyspora xinjiangensis]
MKVSQTLVNITALTLRPSCLRSILRQRIDFVLLRTDSTVKPEETLRLGI